MRLSIPPLALLELLLAAAILAVGWPSGLSALRRLPAEITLEAIKNGQPVDQADTENVLATLESVAAESATARADLAFALLADQSNDTGRSLPARAARAAQELRAYLAEAPGDSLRWAGLADAELLQDHRMEALNALKMSILTSPGSSSLLLWRCGVGIDLYSSLDTEGRELLSGQLSLAADRSLASLVKLSQQRNVVPVVRLLLRNSPQALEKFDAQVGRRQ